MGAATAALSEAVTQTLRSPRLVLATFLAGLVGGVAAGIVGVVGSLLVVGQLLAGPVFATFMAGVVGMAAAGAREGGTASLSDYADTLGEAGVTVFLAYLLKNVVLLVVGMVLAVVLFVVPLFALGQSGTAAPTPETPSPPPDPGALEGLLAGAGAVFLALALAFALVMLLLQAVFQFLDSSAVVGGNGVGEAFADAWGLVAGNPVSVLGFSVLRAGLFLVVFVLVAAFAAVGAELSSALGSAALVAGLLVGYPLAGTVAYVYEVRYYLRLRPETTAAGDDQATRGEPTATQWDRR